MENPTRAPNAIVLLPFSIENCAEMGTSRKTQPVCLPKETVEAQFSGKVQVKINIEKHEITYAHQISVAMVVDIGDCKI